MNRSPAPSDWFDQQLPGAGWTRRILRRLFGLDVWSKVVAELQGGDPDVSISHRVVRSMGIRARVNALELQALPSTGALIVLANHPSGFLECALIHDLLSGRRQDIRFLANPFLREIPEIENLLIGIDPFARRAMISRNAAGLRQALRHLLEGGALVVFPAGEVAHLRWMPWKVEESAWQAVPSYLLKWMRRRASPVSLFSVRVSGAKNSPLFHLLGLIHPRLRTAMLPREMLNKWGCEVAVRIGQVGLAQNSLAHGGPELAVPYLRWRNELLAQPVPVYVATPVCTPAFVRPELFAELSLLPPGCALDRQGEFEVFIAQAHQIPRLLEEIGRLRASAFRDAASGLDVDIDLDRFDKWYEHLFVWNHRASELVAAYRLAPVARVRHAYGRAGFYSATLFHYGDVFLDRLESGLELGRSFVSPKYQRSYAPLMLLWRGIYKYLLLHRPCAQLFGVVSVGNHYSPVARVIMAEFLSRPELATDLSPLVRARHKLDRNHPLNRPDWIAQMHESEVSLILRDLHPKQQGLPPLLKHYLRLGARTLAIGIDKNFANSMDIFMLVDFDRLGSRMLRRFKSVENSHSAGLSPPC